MIAELIAAGRFRVFPDAARFLIAVRQAGCRTAVASSSLNAGAMLSVVRPHFVLGGSPDGPTMIELFDVDVCGRAFKPGKPHPKIFQAAIAEFGLRPADCVVVEDATSGVLAAKAAGAFCLGVARLGNDAALRECGADWAVESLDSVAVEAVKPQGGPPSAELRV
jgi:beta-phosphoglucomutase-like phosphatase (HAD superfamily)